MRLLRHGPAGLERPGILDAQGQVRDLTVIVHDIAGATLTDAGLSSLRALDPRTLPLVAPGTRLGPCVGPSGASGAPGAGRAVSIRAALSVQRLT